MEGIQYLVNDGGERVAVLIDLRKYGQIWEDFYDCLLADLRSGEPRETFDYVRERLREQGKLDA